MQDLASRRARSSTGPRGGTRSRGAPPHRGASRPLRRAVRGERGASAAARVLRRRRSRGARVRGGARAPQGRAAHRQVQVDGDRGDRPQPRPGGRRASRSSRPTSASSSSSSAASGRSTSSGRPSTRRSTQIGELFSRARRRGARRRTPTALPRFARRRLREKFLKADMGITGANFGVAETRHGRPRDQRGQRPPDDHAAADARRRDGHRAPGARTCESLEPILTVLPWAGGRRAHHLVRHRHHRSAPRRATPTAPTSSTSCSSTTAARRSSVRPTRRSCTASAAARVSTSAPCTVRSAATPTTPHTPVPSARSSAHSSKGSRGTWSFPSRSSLCGACSEVCSAGIPLTEHLYGLRRDAIEQGLGSPAWEAGFAAFATATERPRLFALAERLARTLLRPFARNGIVRRGPGPLAAWTHARDLSLPAKRSFRRLWRERPAGDDRRPRQEGDRR